MGDVISLAGRRAERARVAVARSTPPIFYFDLACPLSYLEAEGVGRLLGTVQWVPVSTLALVGAELQREAWAWAERRATERRSTERHASERRAAERRAQELHLPLVWPERTQPAAPAALRAARFAVAQGAGERFALAAGRLAFCGGFDLEDPEVLNEAAAAADLPLADTLAAASDPRHDDELQCTADELREHRIECLPAVRAGDTWHQGTGAVGAAAALVGLRRGHGPGLAPAG